MYDHDVFSSVLGAKRAATTRSAAMASQIGRNRAATSALATACPERLIVAATAVPSPSTGELTDRPIQSGETVKSEPRPDVHSVHFACEVSTVTERKRRSVHRLRTLRTPFHSAASRFNTGKSRIPSG